MKNRFRKEYENIYIQLSYLKLNYETFQNVILYEQSKLKRQSIFQKQNIIICCRSYYDLQLVVCLHLYPFSC